MLALMVVWAVIEGSISYHIWHGASVFKFHDIHTSYPNVWQWNGPDSWFIYFRSGDLITTILNLTYVMLTCDLSISTFSIITSMLTCHLLMSICNISMSTCNIIMPICQMILLTCNLNYTAYWQNKSHVNIIMLHVDIIYQMYNDEVK